jgi:hypothetical protein
VSKSPVMNHDENKRQEFKDKTLKRVYEALNNTAKTSKPAIKVNIKGLMPKKGEEGS